MGFSTVAINPTRSLESNETSANGIIRLVCRALTTRKQSLEIDQAAKKKRPMSLGVIYAVENEERRMNARRFT